MLAPSVIMLTSRPTGSASSPNAPKLGLYPPVIITLVPIFRMLALQSLR